MLRVLFALVAVEACSEAHLESYGNELATDVPVAANNSAQCCQACWALDSCRGAQFRPETQSCLLLKSWKGTSKHPTNVFLWKTRGLQHRDVYFIVVACACLIVALVGCARQLSDLCRTPDPVGPERNQAEAERYQILVA